VFLQLDLIGLFLANTAYLHLEYMIHRKYSFQKITQFSQGNRALDVSASNLHGFLWKDTCVSSTQLNSPVWNKMIIFPP
jgi:hypothetical protein